MQKLDLSALARPMMRLLLAVTLPACGNPEGEMPRDVARPAQLMQGLREDKQFACGGALMAYAAVDSSATECRASIVVSDNRIFSPTSNLHKTGVVCIQIADGSKEQCQSLEWNATYNTWLTTLGVSHGGHGCYMTAVAGVGAEGGCPAPTNTVAFAQDDRF